MIGKHIRVHTGTLGGNAQAGASDTMPPTVRQTHYAWSNIVSDFDRCFHASNTTRYSRKPAIYKAQIGSVVGMNVQRSSRLTLDENLNVVHPRVV